MESPLGLWLPAEASPDVAFLWRKRVSRSRAARRRPSVCRGAPAAAPSRRSDRADEVERGGEGLAAFFPLGRADLARMGRDVLRRLDLADELRRVAADAAGGDLDDLDLAVGVDDERAAVGEARLLDVDVEVARQLGRSGRRSARILILPIAFDVSCQALWLKWVSVETP